MLLLSKTALIYNSILLLLGMVVTPLAACFAVFLLTHPNHLTRAKVMAMLLALTSALIYHKLWGNFGWAVAVLFYLPLGTAVVNLTRGALKP